MILIRIYNRIYILSLKWFTTLGISVEEFQANGTEAKHFMAAKAGSVRPIFRAVQN